MVKSFLKISQKIFHGSHISGSLMDCIEIYLKIIKLESFWDGHQEFRFFYDLGR